MRTRGRSSGPSHHPGLCCPSGSSGTTAASDAHPARAHFPGSPVIGRNAPTTPSADRRAGEGLPSSRRHPPTVPRPIRRGVPRGCTSRLFTPSVAFTLTDRARLSLSPASRRVRSRRGRLRFTLRTGRLPPQKGFRRWASTRPVSRPSRQPATGPPGSYPDGTHTRWRRRASAGSGHLDSTTSNRWAHPVARRT